MTTRDDDDKKVFLPYHTSNHQYYAQWCFEHGSIVTEKHVGVTSYTTSAEYEPIPFDVAWPEESTRLDCLRYTAFWRRWSNKIPKLIIKSKALDVCDACYIFCNYYKSLKKESYEKSDDFIDDDDDDDDDDVVDGDVKGPGVITDVELEVQNTQYTKKSWHVLSSHLQIIKADDLKERCKNKIIHTKAQCYSDHAHMP